MTRPRLFRKVEDDAFEVLAGAVCAAFDVPRRAVFARTRGRATATLARQTLAYLANRHLGFGFARIGRKLGRDHTTILHAVRTIEDRRDDPGLDRLLEEVAQAVRYELGEKPPKPLVRRVRPVQLRLPRRLRRRAPIPYPDFARYTA